MLERIRSRGSADGERGGARPCRESSLHLGPALAFALVLVLGAAAETAAQGPAGRIAGQVIAAGTGESLAGVQVHVPALGIGTLTDGSGRYVLPRVPEGSYDVVARMIGYEARTVADVTVSGTALTRVDIELASAAVEVGGVEVAARRERGSANYLLDRRRSSSSVVESLGAMEIGRSPASNAAEAAGRMTGVTVTGGKHVFIRGMGERYSQTLLNGSPLPSPEPEKNVVPLDLFPADFLESLSTQKSYTPDLPADFSGGTVQIATKDFPDELLFKTSLATSINTRSQFRQGYLTYPGGRLDFVGLDDGTRALPDAVVERLGGLRGRRMSSDRAVRGAIGVALPKRFEPAADGSAPLNRSLDLSVGNRFELFDRDIGFIAGLTYSDSYTLRTMVERKWRASAFDPSLPAERREPNAGYTFDTGTRSVSLGTIANASVRLAPDQQLSLETMYNRNADDEARRFEGENREDLGGVIRNERLRYVSRSLLLGQLGGEHGLPLQSRLEWQLNTARATRDEPALREAIYIRPFGREDAPFYLESAGQSARYFYSDLRDADMGGRLDWEVPFPVLSDLSGSLKTGLAVRRRQRDFAARRFYWQFAGGGITDLTAALDTSAIVGRPSRPGEFAITEIVEPGDRYGVDEQRDAGYIMLDLPIGGSVRSLVGGRVERYRLDLVSRGDTVAARDRTELLPAVNLAYRPSERMNVRAAFSRTLDAPEFRELAPFQFTEATSLRQVYGNPELVTARIQSADLRWEWFPAPGEVVSLGAFYKQLENPIEQVFFATASTAYSYQTAEQARVKGIEFDVRYHLGSAGTALDPFTARANVSLIDSDVEVVRGGAFQPTNLERPLEGQAPYVSNTSLVYHPAGGSPEIGLYHNLVGPRLVAAGGGGMPDIYEQPRNQLDLTFATALPGGARLELEAENLLDSEHRFEQTANGITVVQKRYTEGRSFSVTLGYEF